MAQEPVTVFDPTVDAITTTTPSAAVALKKRTDINRTVRGYQGRMQKLYQKLIDKNPDAQGVVSLSLIISPSGQVINVSINYSEIDNNHFLQEILRLVRSMKFESGDFEETESDYKFSFSGG